MEEILHYIKIILWVFQVFIMGIITYRIFRKNISLKKAGYKIFPLNKSKYLIVEYFVIIILIINLFLFLIVNNQNIEIITIICSSIILIYLNMKIYDRSNGIYEFGIIFNNFYHWKKIFSYYYSQKNTVSIFINTKKKIIEVKMSINEDDCEKINKIMEKNNINYKNIFELV